MLKLLEHFFPARTCLSADLVNVDFVHDSCLKTFAMHKHINDFDGE